MKRYNTRTQQLYSTPGLFEVQSILYCGANERYHRYVPELKEIMPDCVIDVVEVIEEYVEWCRQSQYFRECYHSDIVNFQPDKQYDCVMCLHLLEHLPLEDARKVVSTLKQHCSLFIAAVPWGNVPSLPDGKQAEGYDRHLVSYDRATFRDAFELTRMSVVGEIDTPGNQLLGSWRRRA